MALISAIRAHRGFSYKLSIVDHLQRGIHTCYQLIRFGKALECMKFHFVS